MPGPHQNFTIPAKFADKRHDGQVYRSDMEVERAGIMKLVMTPPPEWSVDRMLDLPVRDAWTAVKDLGLDLAQQNSWARYLNEIVDGSPEEYQLRQQLMERLNQEDWDSQRKQILFRRSMMLYRNTTRKSMTVYTIDNLHKAMGARGMLRHTRAPDPQLTLSKAGGEGSRGGNVTGHTASGKPIYGDKGAGKSGAETPQTKRAHEIATKAVQDLKTVMKDPNTTDVHSLMLTATAAARMDPSLKPKMAQLARIVRGVEINADSKKVVDKAIKMLSKAVDPQAYLLMNRTQRVHHFYQLDEGQRADLHSGLQGLRKAAPRGGTYHRRVPKKGGGHRYYYDADKYNASKDAHQSGEDMTKYAMGEDMMRAIDGAGDGGCDAKGLSSVAKKYGSAETVASLRKRCGKDGDIEHKKGRFYKRKVAEPAKAKR